MNLVTEAATVPVVPTLMPKRSYNQYCALANALDRVGQRWTLLVVRQLMTGPKRFKDLLGGLPGIGTNLLSDRLRQLEEDGILARATLPAPAASAVYELTEIGRGLEPAVLALAQWGRPFLGAPRKGEAFQPTWILVAMKSVFRPEAAHGIRETYEYRIDGEVFHVRIEDGTVEVGQGPGWQPVFVFISDAQTFLRVGTGQLDPEAAIGSGALKLEGSWEAFMRSFEIFGVAAGTEER